MTKNELVNRLRELKKELNQKFGIEKFALFGSYARDEADENSDVDIAILKIREKDYFTRARAVYFLEEKLRKKVDMGYLDSMRTYLRNQIKEEMVDV